MTSMLIVLLAILFVARAEENPTMLSWDVSAKLKTGGKQLLSGVTGTARKGRLHAVMGPSGSGKSTLISILTNTVPFGSLSINGVVNAQQKTEIIYVEQQDLLFAQLTSSETLITSGTLKLQDNSVVNRGSLVELASKSLGRLGLKKVAGTKVGDAKTRGLSGGEKKRLAIANELIATREDSDKPLAIFADEPTSGLDDFQAKNIMQLLRELADDGNTVVCAVHQPRASVMAMFDELTLLSEGGKVCYSGPLKEIAAYFKKIGYESPRDISLGEFLLDLVSVDYTNPDTERESRGRVEAIQHAFLTSTQASNIRAQLEEDATAMASASTRSSSSATTSSKKASVGIRTRLLFTKTGTLLQRAWRSVTRDKALNVARFMSSTFSALLFGAIYFKLGKGAGTVPDRLGLLQVAAVNTAMTSLIKATTSFVQEKLIVNRERRAGSYSVLPYFVSKLVAEAPLSAFFPCFAGTLMYKLCGLNPAPGRLLRFLSILTIESFASSSLGMLVGSYASSVDSAIATAPAVMVIFIVFGGLYVVNTPQWLSWVPKVSLIRWAYEALVVNELDGLELTPESRIGPKSVSNGNQVLESLGYGASTVKRALLAQAGIIGFNYVATYISLVRQRPKFEPLLPYEHEQEGNVDVLAAIEEGETREEDEEDDEEEDEEEGNVDVDSEGRVKRLKRRRRSSITSSTPRRAPVKPAMPTP